jgi:flavin-dependent dehydrogenase
VAVIGAGPAGATVALLLARAGWNVALLDRSPFPRLKPCGDCLSPGAGPILERLGLADAVRAQHPALLDGWRIIAPGGGAFEARFADIDGAGATTAFALSRDRLDHALARAARDAGASFHPGARVDDLLRGAGGRVAGVSGRNRHGHPFRLRSRLVIGADGLRSVTARRLGLAGRPARLRKLSLTAHLIGVRDLNSLGEMHLGDGAVAGIAPVVDDPSGNDPVANVTLVVDAVRFGRLVAADPAAFFRDRLRTFPRLAGRLDDTRPARATADPRAQHSDDLPATAWPGDLLASGPFDRPGAGVIADGAALVGDAAGYFDPLSGQGIHHALHAAGILAEEADAALRNGRTDARALARYARRHARAVRGTRVLQHFLEAIVARPRLADLAIPPLARAPRAAALLLATTGDLRPAHSLLSPAAIAEYLLAL